MDDDNGDGVRIGNKEEGFGRKVGSYFKSGVEWIWPRYSTGEFKLSSQYQAAMEAFVIEK